MTFVARRNVPAFATEQPMREPERRGKGTIWTQRWEGEQKNERQREKALRDMMEDEIISCETGRAANSASHTHKRARTRTHTSEERKRVVTMVTTEVRDTYGAVAAKLWEDGEVGGVEELCVETSEREERSGGGGCTRLHLFRYRFLP